ncbi:MAG: ComEC/Rec2 family competence protein, partial [Pseudohongiella sp.]|nr:ComEC/Rec2 family competence protein [Pseudohongiella sp.]
MRLQLLSVCCGIALDSEMRSVPLLLMDNFQSASVLAGVLCLASLTLAGVLAYLQPIMAAWRLNTLTVHSHVMLTLLSYGLLLMAGFCWAMMLAQQQLHRRLPLALEGQDFWVIGQVASLVRGQTDADTAVDAGFGNRRTRQFEFDLESACLRLKPELCAADKPLMKGMRVTLSDYSALPIQAGQRWQLRVRVNRPHSFSNPGVHDFEAGQFQRGIMARGYIRETSFNQALPPARWSINSWRAALASQIDNAGGQSKQQLNHPGLLKALVIGDREGVSDQQWALFTSTGTNHLVVISGLHVGFIALCAWTLVNGLVRVSPALMLMLPAQQWAAMAAILAALCYSVMAGFS